MDAMNFAYWLTGFAELVRDEPPTADQWRVIKERLALVLERPAYGLNDYRQNMQTAQQNRSL